MAPRAYFITFTTYGTWLRGDRRGWTRHDQHRHGFEPPDPALESLDRSKLRAPPVLLTPPMRDLVGRTIREVCAHRTWTLAALSVRTNHIHAVLTADPPPEPVMTTLKSWSTRRLREANLSDPDMPVWAGHGSTRYLNDHASLAAATDYIERFQDNRTGRFGGAAGV